MELQLSLLDASLNQFFEDSDVGRFFDSRFIFRLRRCLGVLEVSDLRLELLIELPQRLLFTNVILTVKSSLLPIAI